MHREGAVPYIVSFHVGLAQLAFVRVLDPVEVGVPPEGEGGAVLVATADYRDFLAPAHFFVAKLNFPVYEEAIRVSIITNRVFPDPLNILESFQDLHLRVLGRNCFGRFAVVHRRYGPGKGAALGGV